MEQPKYKQEYQPSEEKSVEELSKESIEAFKEKMSREKDERKEKQLVAEGKASYVIDEKGERTIDLTEEQIEEIKNQKESKKEGVSRNEKPEKEIFSSKQNQDVFEQLGGATIEVVSGVYKNVKGGFVDRYRASGNNKLYSYHKERVATLEKDAAMGRSNGVQGTPGFFINGKPLTGAQPFSAFKIIIDSKL